MIAPKVRIKIEQIARLRVAAILKDEEIAQQVGLTRSGLSRILALPEYAQREAEILNQVSENYDKALADNVDALRSRFAVGVPLAMRGLLETVQQKQDLRSRLAAATEILDRDPRRTFAKPDKSNGNGTEGRASFYGGPLARVNANGAASPALPAKAFADKDHEVGEATLSDSDLSRLLSESEAPEGTGT